MDCICMGKVKQAQRAHIVGSGSRVRRSGGSCVRAANLEVGARQTSNLNNIFGLYIDYREGLTGKLNSIKFLAFVQRIIEHFFILCVTEVSISTARSCVVIGYWGRRTNIFTTICLLPSNLWHKRNGKKIESKKTKTLFKFAIV